MSNIKKTKVNKGYTKDERELHISYILDDEIATVYTAISTYKTKLLKAGAVLVAYDYYLNKDNEEVEVSWKFEINPRQLSFRKPPKKEEDMTPEELEKKRVKAEQAGARFKKMYAEKNK